MTNYEKKFGTVEQAASTLSDGRGCLLAVCKGCILEDKNYPCYSSFDTCAEAILAWLREEATDES